MTESVGFTTRKQSFGERLTKRSDKGFKGFLIECLVLLFAVITRKNRKRHTECSKDFLIDELEGIRVHHCDFTLEGDEFTLKVQRHESRFIVL